MTMGTASTMTAAAEALGLTLPAPRRSPRSTPATAAWRRLRPRVVELVWEDRSRATFSTSVVRQRVITVLALGGSTNAVIHLIALARRAGVGLARSVRRLSRRHRCWPTSGPPGAS